MGPLTPEMKRLKEQREGDIKFPVTWTTFGGYLDMLEKKGISPNVASFVGAGTVRVNLLGEADVQPTPQQLAAMQGLVKQAMEEGALGLTDALIYSPNTYAKTPELIALAKISAQCGGIFTVHPRNEDDRLKEAVQEIVDIAQASGAPAEIYHFKQAGRSNWGKLDEEVAMVNARPRQRRAHYGRHVHLYFGRHGPRCGDAVLGAGWRAGEMDRAAQGSGHPRQGGDRDARSPPQDVGQSLWRRGRARHAASGVQESGIEAAHRQDPGRCGEDVEAKARKMRPSIW